MKDNRNDKGRGCDTMSRGSIGLLCVLYLLPLDATHPTPLVPQEPIPYPMKDKIIKDFYSKVRHTFRGSATRKS